MVLPLIGAALAGAGLISNFITGNRSNDIAEQNQAFQQQQAAEAQRMGRATRTDQYGNKTYYDPTTNEWKVLLTPMQQALLNAEQTEQSRSINEDAPRARRLRERQAQMSEAAAEPYNEALQGYMYDKPESRGAIEDRLQTQIINANREKGKEGQAEIIRSTLRQGGKPNINALIKKIDEKIAGGTSDAILQAGDTARTQDIQNTQAHDSRYLPEISAFENTIAQGGGGAGARFGTATNAAAQQQQQNAAMLQALSASMSGNNAATNNLIRANQQSKLDFNPLIKAINNVKVGNSDDGQPKTDFSVLPDLFKDLELGRLASNDDYSQSYF